MLATNSLEKASDLRHGYSGEEELLAVALQACSEALATMQTLVQVAKAGDWHTVFQASRGIEEVKWNIQEEHDRLCAARKR